MAERWGTEEAMWGTEEVRWGTEEGRWSAKEGRWGEGDFLTERTETKACKRDGKRGVGVLRGGFIQ